MEHEHDKDARIDRESNPGSAKIDREWNPGSLSLKARMLTSTYSAGQKHCYCCRLHKIQ